MGLTETGVLVWFGYRSATVPLSVIENSLTRQEGNEAAVGHEVLCMSLLPTVSVLVSDIAQRLGR